MDEVFSDFNTLFNPDCVAVIGASDNPEKLGYHVMKSLSEGGYPGKIIPVNPGSSDVFGINTFPSVGDYEGHIDLAIVVVPSKHVPAIFLECEDKGVKSIVLISAGFKEIDDPAGAELHEEIASIANRAGIPVIGPNTFGIINKHADLNASFTPELSLIKKGSIALISQSGGISHQLAFMAMKTDSGFSKIVGLGNRLNVDFSHMLRYLMEDPETDAIVLYMEGIDKSREFIEVAKEIRTQKPIIAFKTGKGTVGDQASLSHTGSMAGRHEIYTGSFSQAGILTVNDTEELLDAADALSGCPVPPGPRVAVLSGQAGPGMAACDVCETRGLKIAPFTGTTQENINRLLPPLALRTNPVDMGPAWYDSSAIREIVRSVMHDKNIDGVLLLMMFASANVDAVKEISDLLIELAQQKPLISCILSPPGIWDEQVQTLEVSGALVNFPTPERAARAMANLWQYGRVKS